MSRSFSHARLALLLKRPRTFLRHDVDVSLAAALKMASLESSLGVRSVFYLMADSPFYTLHEAFAFVLQASSFGGHYFGWHVDPREIEPAQISSWDTQAFISFHCPRETELWQKFDGFNSAYDPYWRGRYYADSRGRFDYGDPEDHSDDLIQVNLHPEWWFEPDWHETVGDELYESFFHEPKAQLWAS